MVKYHDLNLQYKNLTHAIFDFDDDDIWVRSEGSQDRPHGHEAGHEYLGAQQIRDQREVPCVVQRHLARHHPDTTPQSAVIGRKLDGK